MRMGSRWANPNAGNQNFIRSGWGYNSDIGAWDWDRPGPTVTPVNRVGPTNPISPPKPATPQMRVKPVTPAPIVRTPVTQPETQIKPKPRMSGASPVGQTQNTMPPGGNQSAFGNPSVRNFKNGGSVTTCKVSTSQKNKSQPKW